MRRGPTAQAQWPAGTAHAMDDITISNITMAKARDEPVSLDALLPLEREGNSAVTGLPDDLQAQAARRLRIVTALYAFAFVISSPVTAILSPDERREFFSSALRWAPSVISIGAALLVAALTWSRRITARTVLAVGEGTRLRLGQFDDVAGLQRAVADHRVAGPAGVCERARPDQREPIGFLRVELLQPRDQPFGGLQPREAGILPELLVGDRLIAREPAIQSGEAGRTSSVSACCTWRGDFEPLISEDLFYRVQAVLSGRVPSTTPQQRAHPDFPLRTFVRCEACGRGLTGSWSKGPRRSVLEFEMTLCEGAARTRFQVAFEADRSLLIRELDDDVKQPRSARCRMWAAPSVMVGQSRVHIGCQANVKLVIWRCVLSRRRRDACIPAMNPTSTANHIPDNERERREDFG